MPIDREKEKIWIHELPELVAEMASSLDLRDLKEVTHLSDHSVLSGFQGNNPIILKLSLDSKNLAREAFALKCFSENGAIKLLAEDKGILLLERAIPGHSLKKSFPDKEEESIKIACALMKKLHQASIPENHPFPDMKDWLRDLDKDWPLPHQYLQKARKRRDQLLATSEKKVLLHGDLHHDNILKKGEEWVAIDPKGVMGESAYEVAAFIRNPIPELLNQADAPNIISNRLIHFSKLLELSPQRILDCCLVQSLLSWIWAIEDAWDTDYFQAIFIILDQLDYKFLSEKNKIYLLNS